MRIFISLLVLTLPSTVMAGEHDWPSIHVWPEVYSTKVILYFTQGERCPPCVRQETEVFPELRKKGWLIEGPGKASNIRILDIEKYPECAAAYKIDTTPTFVLIDLMDGVKPAKELSRLVGYQSAQQLIDWRTGKEKSASTRKSYPLRWKNWTGPVWARESAVTHLLNDGTHGGKFTRQKLEKLTLSELQALHSDDHERRVQWSVLNN